MEIPLPVYRIQDPEAPIAILMNEATTSAGELLVVAFRGWPQTRSFGQRTRGQVTSPEGFRMPDGTNLAISTAYYTDHNGIVYTDRIRAEEPLSSRENPILRSDAVPQAALDWLATRPACQK